MKKWLDATIYQLSNLMTFYKLKWGTRDEKGFLLLCPFIIPFSIKAVLMLFSSAAWTMISPLSG
jgi:hypothetical protein